MLNRHRTGLTLAFCSIIACCGQSFATDYYLEADGSGDFATIQAAINAALNGDTIWLADGTYTGTGNRDVSFNGKQVTVVSENGPESCIIDCQGSAIDPHRAFIFNNGEAVYSHIQGFTITGGIGPDQIDDGGGNMIDYCGGAVLCESANPWIVDCVFVGNQAKYGGAISCDQSSPWIFACVFTENAATLCGGAISNRNYSSPLILNTTFDSNENYMSGGALYNHDHSSPTIHFSRFYGNGSTHWGSAGGAIANHQYSSPGINRSIFKGNQAGAAGAMSNSQYSSPTIYNSLFTDNQAHFDVGGAISNYAYSSPQLINCTVAYNSSDSLGGGMDSRYDCEPQVTNCIFWGNLGGGGSQLTFYYCPYYTQAVNYSTLTNGYPWGTGNSSANPTFLDDAVGDFRLAPGSPCIDSGDKTANTQSYDYYGWPRFVDDPYTTDTGVETPPIDRGYSEYGDCNNNQIPDADEIAAGTAEDCNGNGYPEECDMQTGLAPDCNENGISDDCEILHESTPDCNANDIPDSCDIQSEFSQDCNANGIPDECDVANGIDPDCNTNGIPDSCDIADETSNDCNTNGVPDECDIAGDTSRDINEDGVPDDCQIVNYFSTDIVFAYDSSGSMQYEINSLHASIDNMTLEIEFALAPCESVVTYVEYKIASTGDKSDPVPTTSSTITWDGVILDLYGSTPGLSYPLTMNEDWAPAVSVVSAERSWPAGYRRIIVTLSDEGPYRGNPLSSSDENAVDEANGIAISNEVAVVPLIINNTTPALHDLADELADGTCADSTGFYINTSVPGWEEDVITHILKTCLADGH